MVNRYLLDTHTFLWASYESRVFKLSEEVKRVIEDPAAELYISSVSLFEIANKYRIGKLPEYRSIAKNCTDAMEGLEAKELPLDSRQAYLAGGLDWPHKDPFDRLLAAQAQTENMTLITCDKAFDDAPGVNILW